MSKTIYILSQIPELAKLTARALPACQVIDIELRQCTGKPSRGLKIDDRELNDLRNAEIVFGDPNLLVQTFHKLPNIQWMQSTWAGIDLFLKVISETGQKPPQCPITRFSGESFGQLIFDYCIAHIIIHERKLFQNYIDTKQNKIWQLDMDCRTVNEVTIAILGGTGAIGSFVAKKFSLLGSKVTGYGRTESGNISNFKEIPLAKYSTKLEDILPESDYIISVLPSTPQTMGLLNNDILQMCKDKSPVLINVGRGTLISEKDIIKAIDNRWISAAILDVFEIEPLPQNSLLWSHPNVFITPHNSAVSRAKDCVKLFVENYNKFVGNEKLLYTINWNSGY
ncbi:glyoxylate/hydroxypyruvate reductase A-like [Bradysia coprophila]|uniref:glyoxylate/hydroxypyruvate reductase A-like n=1 Tax=Bradysia coprophila TaxID=38358 RepID=UPI00187DBB3A|nr:glyoxylate/hydroxypyruvate reductase A-like [Bradysia coprophila]